MASAPDIVALVVVTVDKQRHAVATSQQLVGCSQSYTSLNVASIDNQAVEAVIDRRDRGTVSAAASKAVNVHGRIGTALQNSAVHAQADSAVLCIDIQVLDNDGDALANMELFGDIVDVLIGRQRGSTDAGLNAKGFCNDIVGTGRQLYAIGAGIH